MSSISTKKLLAVAAALTVAATFGLLGPAAADPAPSHHGRITVENVWITPGRTGDQSMLRFRIINESEDPVHLLGVTTPIALDTRIIGRIGDHETATFESVSVRADTDLDLTSDHMWIELGPLTREVKSGETIPLELVFLRTRIRTEAHVHGIGG